MPKGKEVSSVFDAPVVFSGLGLLLSINNIFLLLIGVLVGAIFGALPGFTSAMGIAVMLPLTFAMHPEGAILTLASIYCGAMYGGSIPAILLRTPGTAGAAATVFDGYPMAQKGFAHKALITSAVASGMGGLFSAIVLFLMGPLLSYYALKFGPAEIFLIVLFGLTVLGSVSRENVVRGLLSGSFGLLLGTIGVDYRVAFPRMTFGITALFDGVPMIAALIGLLAFSELMFSVQKESLVTESEKIYVNIKTILRDALDVFSYPIDLLRAAIIGTVIGSIPGEGAAVANFVSYDQAKRFSKKSHLFGTGVTEGIIASEAANNAVTGGAMIPTFALGIPGSSSTALLLGGMMIHGLRAGPGIFERHGEIIYAVLWALLLANLVVIVIGVVGAKYLAKIINIPTRILVPIITMLTIIGSFAIRNNIFDVFIMLCFGILGYLLQKTGFSPVAAVIGLILGPLAERSFVTALNLSGGSYAIFFTSAICIVLWLLIVATLVVPYLLENRRARRRQKLL